MNYRTVFHNLGNILIIESLFLLLPVLVAVLYRETAGFAFAVTAAGTFFTGMLLTHFCSLVKFRGLQMRCLRVFPALRLPAPRLCRMWKNSAGVFFSGAA